MSRFDEMITVMKEADYPKKQQFLQYLTQMAERAKHQFSQEDKQALLSYAFEEVEAMRKQIPLAASYREKDGIFACEDFLLGLVMHLSGSADQIPQEQLMKIQALVDLVNKERYIEETLDSIFQQDTISLSDVNRLLYWVRSTNDEYQKSKLWQGLLHYQSKLSILSDDVKQILTDYAASEMQRLLVLENQDAWDALELLADVSKYFASEQVVSALHALLQLNRNHIRYYAVASLCRLNAEIPQDVILSLAQDLEYADLTYRALQQCGKAGLFPAECATEEYLAKSDLVHWLTYPTELGKVPDEIVYLGKSKRLFQKEVFHVFKYRSDSETLDDEKRNHWLIGWSSNEGGTFSTFDAFAPFAEMPMKTALKKIRKQIIG